MLDDGELLGMVGWLIFEVLCYYDFDGVFGVVVCYYGGVKFGVGGLVCVYMDVIVLVLFDVECVECIWYMWFVIEIGYLEEVCVCCWIE